MKHRPRARRRSIYAALVACFVAGCVCGWLLRDKGPPLPVGWHADASSRPGAEAIGSPASAGNAPTVSDRTVSTTGEPTIGAAPPGLAAIEDLRRRDLRLPIDSIDVSRLKGMFAESRDGRAHEAVDILAPRNTPIHAVEDGTIAKLFFSKAGGTTVYEFDPGQRFVYYYAHLERYADGLREGQRIARGDVLGYVGTSGNAPPGTPHLHFAVFALTADRRWWQGQPIDPFLVLSH